jgi:hypothetical protein
VAERHAVDAIGLGGYGGLPFARAALAGEGAIVELLERLDPGERPQYLALYPAWFPEITRRFGAEIDRVTIANNVICGGPTKHLYRALWSGLCGENEACTDAPAGAVDTLDPADLVSERAHAYVPPRPLAVLGVHASEQGEPLFDGGREVRAGEAEAFVARGGTSGAARFVVRTDDEGATAEGTVEVVTRGGIRERALLAARPPSALTVNAPTWRYVEAHLGSGVVAGDTVRVTCARGTLRDHHAWIVAESY